jgi:hypothetical protein
LEGYARAATELTAGTDISELRALRCHDYLYLVLGFGASNL